ncbi:MAG: heme biosynthesis protein HemY [Gammaproteobacteria bacterium]|nr:heme biosynthesis protein HemY [Gammaproteobacteria bacterium]
MRFLIIILLALFIAAVAGSYASSSTGHIVLTYAGWTIQTSLVFFLLLLVILFLLIYISIRLIVHLWNFPERYKYWRYQRHQRLSEKYLTKGLLALIEGNWNLAEESLKKGIPYARVPLINYLGAARAAQLQGALDRRDHYLRCAHEDNPDSKIAVGLARAELQISQKQTEQALATLTHLHDVRPDQKQVKLMLLKTYTDLKSWRKVLELLSGLERARLLSKDIIRVKQLEAYAGLLQQAGKTANKEILENTWQDIPKNLRKELYLLEVYTNEKLKYADNAGCERLLRQSLKKRWDTGIVRLYGLVEGEDSMSQLAFAEKLLAEHTRDPALLLTLGRLSIRNSLWGKARAYLEESIKREPNPESYRELASLLEKQGEYSMASACYQQGLALATTIARHDSVKLLEQAERQEAMCEGARQVV